MNNALFLLVLLLFSCSTRNSRVSSDWRKDSDKIAKSFVNSLAAQDPEEYSILGMSKFDSAVTSFSKNYDQEHHALLYRWSEKFKRFLEVEKNPELRTDIEILLQVANLKMEDFELTKESGAVPFLPVTQFIHQTLSFYFAPNTPAHKTAAAMGRFRKYIRGEGKTLPLVDGFTSLMLARMEYLQRNSKRGFWPMKMELDNYFENSDKYINALERMLSTWKSDEWKRDLEELKNQDAEYRKFLKKKVYSYCRDTNVIPEKFYTLRLKASGIYSSPQSLIQTSLMDYKKTYLKYKKLAGVLAKKHNLSSSDPAIVMGYLRSRSISDNRELMLQYESAANEIFKILQDKKLLTISKKPEYILRFASAAEAQTSPNPQFRGSPFFLGSKIPAQFILPKVQDTQGMDDYNYVESIYTLVAHEGIPGHALQFERLGELKPTIARGHFAFASANVEGWGLYAESIVFPFMTEEGQITFLQRLIWRQARMFLDPQLNLGMIKPSRVIELYTKELGFSAGLAQSELRRYSYLLPAQAPAYYYGLKMILDTKAKVKAKPDTIFDEKCFNDALLNAGLLPLQVISDRLVKDLNCVQH